jgi:hypothetical protein
MGAIVGVAAAVLLLACLVLCGGGCSPKAPAGSSPAVAAGPPVVTSVEGFKSLDRTAIRAMLKTLADAPAPKDLALGAMCYDVAPPPSRADYLCPKCGERTLYDNSKAKQDKPYETTLVEAVEWEIPSCRREFAELRKVAGDTITFDESQFCRKCSPRVAKPRLVLHFSYGDDKTRDVESIKHDDLRILREFLAGKVKAKGDNEGEAALKDSLPRLQELLGVKIDE